MPPHPQNFQARGYARSGKQQSNSGYWAPVSKVTNRGKRELNPVTGLVCIQLAHLDRGNPVIPCPRRIIGGAPVLEIRNIPTGGSPASSEVGVVVKSDGRTMHDFDGGDSVIESRRQIRVTLAPAHAEIVSPEIGIAIEAGTAITAYRPHSNCVDFSAIHTLPCQVSAGAGRDGSSVQRERAPRRLSERSRTVSIAGIAYQFLRRKDVLEKKTLF